MADNIGIKKLSIVRIKEILERYSDEDHPLLQEDIQRLLSDEYGIMLERKAIGRSISLLRDSGMDIVSYKKGSYLAERGLSLSDVQMLQDAVIQCPDLIEKEKEILRNKLCTLLSVHQKTGFEDVTAEENDTRFMDENFYSNMSLLGTAIAGNNAVLFRHDTPLSASGISGRYTVCPVKLLIEGGIYYLISYSKATSSYLRFRVDRIRDLRISGETFSPENMKPFYYVRPPHMVIRLETQENMIESIEEEFGPAEEITYLKGRKGGCIMTVTAYPEKMKTYALSNPSKVLILSPYQLIEDIRAELKAGIRIYG